MGICKLDENINSQYFLGHYNCFSNYNVFAKAVSLAPVYNFISIFDGKPTTR
jgi:hypothetical protein